MKKCTLCIDKIYNENIPKEDRVPACVSTCPAGARSFGDLNDKSSYLFQIIEERDGYDLMPEQNCKPTNKYLPPRENKTKFNKESLKSIINPLNDQEIDFEEWREKISHET